MRELLAALGDPQRALPGDPRRRHERQDLDDADDRGAAARRGAARRARTSRRTCAAGRSGSRSTARDADLEAALARVRPHAARRDAVRGAHGRGARRVRGARGRRRGRRGRARRPARRDERARRARRRAHERRARAHRGARRHARGDRRGEARRRPARARVVVLGEPEWEGAATRGRSGARRGGLAARTSRSPSPRPRPSSAARSTRRRPRRCSVPGRLERRGEQPLEIWDGAHNLAGIGYLLPAAAAAALHDRRLDPRRQGRRRDAAGADRRSATRSSRRSRGTRARCRPTSSRALARPHFAQRRGRARTRRRRLARARALAGPDGAVLVTGSLYLLAALSDQMARTRTISAGPWTPQRLHLRRRPARPLRWACVSPRAG